MNIVAVTYEEGGLWCSLSRIDPNAGGTIFAAKYANGAIWDKVYGWRKHIRIRVKMGRAVV